MSEFSAVAYANTGYTGFLSSSGFDLSLVFMNINAVVSGTGATSYPITSPTMVGYSYKKNGTAIDLSVSSGTTYNVASTTIDPGVYIVTIYVNNTPSTTIGYLQYLTLELSTSSGTLGASAVKLTGSTQVAQSNNNSIIGNITMPLNVNTSATYNLLMSVNWSGYTGVTCKTTTCFISYVKIA
jgi:hypothetical protein